jgi:mono/diheme cytochrome c family protein
MRAAGPMLMVATLWLSGCGDSREARAREYAPDMVRGPAYKAFAPNSATGDGLTLRPPVLGTIARGYHPFHYGPGEPEAERAGRELTNPLPQGPRTLAEGKALYQTYCAVCHGPGGKGNGPLAAKIPTPASYSSERVMAFAPGRIFHVITNGSGKMPSHAGQVSAGERWKIVSYVQNVLQGRGTPAPEARP